MPLLYSMPRLLAPRTRPSYEQKIPKIIWQTLNVTTVPAGLKDWMYTWIDLNPEYSYHFVDDDEMREFIRNRFPSYLEAFKKLKHGASRADLWRYLIIYEYGGIYADVDCICVNPLKEWIAPDAAYVTQLGVNRDVCQWLIISVAGNPIFLRAAERGVQNIVNDVRTAQYRGFRLRNGKLELREQADPIRTGDPVLGLAGPPVLQEAAERCLKNHTCPEIFEHTQVVCYSEQVSCNFSGNVNHDYGNACYLDALKGLNTPHY